MIRSPRSFMRGIAGLSLVAITSLAATSFVSETAVYGNPLQEATTRTDKPSSPVREAAAGLPNASAAARVPPSGTREELELEKLRLEKLRLEIEQLKSPPSPYAPYLPALFAAVTLVVGFFTAWYTGVFEARNHYLKGETAWLEVKKKEFEAANAALSKERSDLEVALEETKQKLASAPAAAFFRKLMEDGRLDSQAIDDLASLLRKDDETKQATRRFLEREADAPETTERLRLVALYALYQGTRDDDLLTSLLQRLSDKAATPDANDDAQNGILDVFGDKRWTDQDRVPVSCELVRHASAMQATPKIKAAMLAQLGRLHLGAHFNYDTPPPVTTWFRLDKSNFSTFAQAVVIARDGSLDDDLPVAIRVICLEALSRFAPPASAAVASVIVQRMEAHLEREGGWTSEKLLACRPFTKAIQNCSDYVKERIKLSVPSSPGESSIDEYLLMRSRSWAEWRAANVEFVALWMEPDLAALRREPARYAEMFDPYH